MESRSIITRLPEGSRAFAFGSALTTTNPRDFDLLVTYDESACPPNVAHRTHLPFLRELEKITDVRVDMTLLTYHEEKNLQFIEKTGAVPILQVLFIRSQIERNAPLISD